MTSCHWGITRLHQDTQKEPLPTVMGSGRLQGWKALDPLWESVAEDVRDIGIGRERGNIGIGKEREAFFLKKKCCFHAFYETAQELVRGMLHRHFVQTGVC